MSYNRETMFYRLIHEICEEEGIVCKGYCDDWIFRLETPTGPEVLYGYRPGIQSDTMTALCDDKAGMSAWLTDAGVPCVEHIYLPSDEVLPFMEESREDYDGKIRALLSDGDCVVKPNNGTGGRGVVRVSVFEEARRACEAIYATGQCACISRFMEIIREIRFIVLEKNVLLAYSKERKTDWRHNLASGAVPQELETLTEPMEVLLEKIQRELPLRAASIDLIETSEGLQVLEINAGIVMEQYASSGQERRKRAKEIYRRLILRTVRGD